MKFMKVITIRKKIPTTVNRSKIRVNFRIFTNGENIVGNNVAIIRATNISIHIISVNISK